MGLSMQSENGALKRLTNLIRRAMAFLSNDSQDHITDPVDTYPSGGMNASTFQLVRGVTGYDGRLSVCQDYPMQDTGSQLL